MYIGSLHIAYSSLFFFRGFLVIPQELPVLLYFTSHSGRATVQLQLRMLARPGLQERGGLQDA